MNRPVYFEFLSADPEKTYGFFQNAFGWKADAVAPGQGYWRMSTGSADAGIDGGLMGQHFPQAVINTLEVASIDDAVAAVAEHGGEVLHGPNDVPGVGRQAYAKDPTGILFGLLERA